MVYNTHPKWVCWVKSKNKYFVFLFKGTNDHLYPFKLGEGLYACVQLYNFITVKHDALWETCLSNNMIMYVISKLLISQGDEPQNLIQL